MNEMEISEGLETLEAEGFIKKTGEMLDGYPVYELTELGHAYHVEAFARAGGQ